MTIERMELTKKGVFGVEEVVMLAQPKICEIVQTSLISSGFLNEFGIPLEDRGLTVNGLYILLINLKLGIKFTLESNVGIVPQGYIIEVLQTTDTLISGLGEAVSEIESGFLVVEFEGKIPAVKKIYSAVDGKKHTGQAKATTILFGPPPVLHIIPISTFNKLNPFTSFGIV